MSELTRSVTSFVEPVLPAFARPGESWSISDALEASVDCLLEITVNGLILGRFWIAGHILESSQPSGIALFAFHAIQHLTQESPLTAGQQRPTCPRHVHPQVVSEVYGGLIVQCPEGGVTAQVVRVPASSSPPDKAFELWVGSTVESAEGHRYVAVVGAGSDARLACISTWEELHHLADTAGEVRFRWPVNGYAWAVDQWGPDPRAVHSLRTR
jgi:hypothetical protein